MDPHSVSIAMTGSGGAGVMTVGQLLLNAAAQAGYYGLFGRTLGPQIRGGESAALVRLADHPVDGPDDGFDLLMAFDWGNIERFAAELPLFPDSLVINDPVSGDVPDIIAKSGAQVIEVPLADIAKGIDGARPNMVGLGLMAALVGLPRDGVVGIVEKVMANKGEAARDGSIEAVSQGHALARQLDTPKTLPQPTPATAERWSLSGNEAAAYGALKGGIRFAAAYPITPSTDVMEWMARGLPRVGGQLVQAEDELAAINMCIGASYGGVPSMTATSGPGYALMSESLGLAVASEVPVLVVDVQRGGPSTGIPTKSEQADLNIAVYGRHGDAPAVVTAPLSLADCALTAQWSAVVAEAVQGPVTMLSEQWIGQARAVIDAPALPDMTAARRTVPDGTEDYERYAVTADGVSPMAVPGTKGAMYTADGLEHDEAGHPSTRAEHHQEQLDKRARKLEAVDHAPYWAEIDGDGADLAVICWGAAAAPVREAVARLGSDGDRVKAIAMRLIYPPRPAEMAAALDGVGKVLVVEQNHSAQFHKFLKGHYDFAVPVESLARPGPLPIRPREVEAAIRRVLDGRPAKE